MKSGCHHNDWLIDESWNTLHLGKCINKHTIYPHI